MDDLLAAALAYAAHAWPVLPCARNKHPIGAAVPHGLRDASTDPDVIRRWWRGYPDAGIGCVTGETWWALDIDPRHGGDDALADLVLRYGTMPETVTCLTGGGGRHFYWRADARVRTGTARRPGLDVRAAGGYTILPPSRHASGRRYAWEIGASPDDLPLAPAPAWLLDLVLAPARAAAAALAPDAPIPVGSRNATLASMAGAMRRRGMSVPAIEAALRIEDATRCVPPLGAREVSRIAASVGRYAPAPAVRPVRRCDEFRVRGGGEWR